MPDICKKSFYFTHFVPKLILIKAMDESYEKVFSEVTCPDGLISARSNS